LARLEGGDLLPGGTFEIHSEPHRPNDETNKPSTDILGNL
jgi:hypothetical protein